MRTTGKRRMATALLLATGTIAFLPSPAFAVPDCGATAGLAVDWTGCDKTGADHIGVDFTGASFDGATFTNANLSGTNLTGVNAPGIVLGGTATLSGATVDQATFTGAQAAGTNMTSLSRVDPLGNDSTNTLTFTNGDFSNADFTNALIYDAEFTKANLQGANFTGADIRNTEFIGADLTGATFDTVANDAQANFIFAPEGAADAATTPFETAVVVDVLDNDGNLNTTEHGRTITVESLSSPAPSGAVVINGDGTLTYTPVTGFSGVATFTYQPMASLPAAWASIIPSRFSLTSTDAATTTVTITVQEKDAPPPPESDPILSAAYQGKAGIEGRIARLYAAYFGRDPDTAGFDFWKARIAAGDWTNDNAATFFSQSDEFVAAYGANLTNEQFIDLVYQNVLGRAGDAEGRAFWLGKLDSGSSRGTVMLQFSDSAEFRTRTKTT